MSGERVYVAAPYLVPILAREAHERLREVGFTPTSTWAARATGPECLTDGFALAAIAENDFDLLSSDAVIALAREGAGGEMFCEISRALVERIPVFWVGTRKILSCYRRGVVCCDSVEEAITKAKAYFDLDEATPIPYALAVST